MMKRLGMHPNTQMRDFSNDLKMIRVDFYTKLN